MGTTLHIYRTAGIFQGEIPDLSAQVWKNLTEPCDVLFGPKVRQTLRRSPSETLLATPLRAAVRTYVYCLPSLPGSSSGVRTGRDVVALDAGPGGSEEVAASVCCTGFCGAACSGGSMRNARFCSSNPFFTSLAPFSISRCTSALASRNWRRARPMVRATSGTPLLPKKRSTNSSTTRSSPPLTSKRRNTLIKGVKVGSLTEGEASHT